MRTWAHAVGVSGGMALVSDDLALLDADARALLDEVVAIGRVADAEAVAGSPARCADLMDHAVPGRLRAGRPSPRGRPGHGHVRARPGLSRARSPCGLQSGPMRVRQLRRRPVRPDRPDGHRDRRQSGHRTGRWRTGSRAAGARVVVASRKADTCAAVAAEIEAAGGQALAVPTHVGRPDEIDRAGRRDRRPRSAASTSW